MSGFITLARKEFHKTILEEILSVNDKGVPTNADKSSRISVEIAFGVLEKLGASRTSERLPGQTSGANFEDICAKFIEVCFLQLGHLRPGQFGIEKGGRISRFDQYAHLEELDALARTNRAMATALGSDYLIKPDIVIFRRPESDQAINNDRELVDEASVRLTPLRQTNSGLDILHGSVSCKWTLRSDRAQNARSEGLNLTRNRKGRLPHVGVVTAEPTPNRIASLALGTGDIDCVYHFALPELKQTLIEQSRDDAAELLDTMIEGKRLRDISDLPFDFVI
jgi:hypothetical protein